MHAHGAVISLTPDSVEIHRSLLGVSLGLPQLERAAFADITSVSTTQPTATSPGFVRLDGADITIDFAPNQDAQACADWIQDAMAHAPSAAAAPACAAPADAALAGSPDTSTGSAAATGAAAGLQGLDFTAVDVETANDNWGSICQIGAVRFRNGIEVDSREWLCTPPAGLEHFDDRNIAIHGITADDVAEAESFTDAAGALVEFVGDDIAVAHNAQFDSSALFFAWRASQANVSPMRFACSLALARYASSKGVLRVANHKLPTVAAAVGAREFHHHDAREDARAAGDIIIGLSRSLGATGTVEEVFAAHGFTLGDINSERVMPLQRANMAPTSGADLGAGTEVRTPRSGLPPKAGSPAHQAGGTTRGQSYGESQSGSGGATGNTRGPQATWQRIAAPDTIPQPAADGPLLGENITLTGDFEPHDKGELWDKIAALGGQVGKNVTKKTTILVVGAWAKKTSKEKRAEELIAKGQEIQVWSADKLFSVLGNQ